MGLIEDPGQADASSRPPREIRLLGALEPLNPIKREEESSQSFAMLCGFTPLPVGPSWLLPAGSQK